VHSYPLRLFTKKKGLTQSNCLQLTRFKTNLSKISNKALIRKKNKKVKIMKMKKLKKMMTKKVKIMKMKKLKTIRTRRAKKTRTKKVKIMNME